MFTFLLFPEAEDGSKVGFFVFFSGNSFLAKVSSTILACRQFHQTLHSHGRNYPFCNSQANTFGKVVSSSQDVFGSSE